VKKHWAYAADAFIPTKDRTQIEWTPNVPELRIRQVGPAELDVEIRSAMPNLNTYVVQPKGGEPQSCDDGHYR
jgi:hypothetical protein